MVHSLRSHSWVRRSLFHNGQNPGPGNIYFCLSAAVRGYLESQIPDPPPTLVSSFTMQTLDSLPDLGQIATAIKLILTDDYFLVAQLTVLVALSSPVLVYKTFYQSD